jgi:hypothetical protein
VPDEGEQRLTGDLVPRPDPTVLTATAVRQAKEDLRRELAQLREILEARMDAMDHARALLLQIMDERAAEIQRRFDERDLRFSERDTARQDAVRTALEAAKELSDARDGAADKAIEKFEAAVREQIGQIGELAESGRQQLSTQIQALKERIDRGEGSASGAQGYRTERRLDYGAIVAALAAVIALAAVLVVAFKK